MVKERPILMSASMVIAILAGRKTQTRRVVKGVDECPHGYDGVVVGTVPQESHLRGKHCFQLASGESAYLSCPYGAPGDRLWVREAWREDIYDHSTHYRASHPSPIGVKWKPSIHMPRVRCRLVLEVTDVRVERLFAITEKDARAEGIFKVPFKHLPGSGWVHDEGQPVSETARRAYEDLWYSINGTWTDCWVWVVTFRRAQ